MDDLARLYPDLAADWRVCGSCALFAAKSPNHSSAYPACSREGVRVKPGVLASNCLKAGDLRHQELVVRIWESGVGDAFPRSVRQRDLKK